MGKLAVPEHILNKPGKLTPGEFEKMKLHASVGAQILSSIDFPYPVVPIVRHHHENWDGTGYPDGLAGLDIPIGARVLAVVDCFDALTSDRPYRPRLNDEAALRILMGRRGSMYDPLVVDAFLRIHLRLGRGESGERGPTADEKTWTELRMSESEAQIREQLRARRQESDSPSATLSAVEKAELVHLANQLVDGALVAMYERDPDADCVIASYCIGPGAEFVTGLRIPLGEGVSGWVAANQKCVTNSDASLESRHDSSNSPSRLRPLLQHSTS